MHADRFRLFVVLIFLCNLSLPACKAEPARREAISNGKSANAGVVFTSSSPFAVLHDVPVQAVTLGEGIWKTRFRTNVERSILSFFGLLEKAGALDKLRGRKNKARGNSDADLAKWMEAVSFVLQSQENSQLHNFLQRVINDISISAEQGGYLQNQYMNAIPADLANLKTSGRLYCLGHLLQAAIAYYRAMGSEQLLNVFVPYIDGVIDRFGPGKQLCWSGHPEIEMALVELYRTTGEKKYLSFAHYLLEEVDLRRTEKAREVDFDHYFAGLPFTSRKELSGHAVCALYACCGATDYYIETGDQEIWRTLLILWHDLTKCKMYVTGGIGSRPSEEAIGEPYELPNERGYAETCAAIGNIMWNWRLLNATGEAHFADVMELTLYNGFLSAVSMDGRKYFYWNPLESRSNAIKERQYNDDQDLLALKKSTGSSLDTRQPYYRTPCCIPNIQRMIASLPGYMYSTSAKGVWIHLYHSSRLNWRLEDGNELVLTQSTAYPWENTVEIVFEGAPAEDFSLFLRIPYWTASVKITVNGRLSYVVRNPGSYYEIRRNWNKKDRVQIVFDMPIRLVRPNPRIRENRGRLALQRGPIIYCLESVDYHDSSVFDIVLTSDLSGTHSPLKARFEPGLLEGVVTLHGSALAYAPSLTDERLYSFVAFCKPLKPVRMKAIPYFAWANRGPSEMTVWILCMKK